MGDFFILDTDTITLWQNGHEPLKAKRAEHEFDLIAASVITVEEALGGWYNLLRRPPQNPEMLAGIYLRMTETVSFLGTLPIVTFDAAVILRFEQLRALKLNVGHNDLRIAAIALENNAIVVTRNIRDFERVPGLQVENWAE